MKKEKNAAAVELGKKGGAKTSKRGPDYYREIGAMGNLAMGKTGKKV